MIDQDTVTGQVVSVNCSTEKGTSKTPVPEIVLDEMGVVQDAHAGAWHRQVSLLSTESIERFAANAGRTFGFGDFAENITTRGVDLPAVAVLDRFLIGPVELEVTQLGKKCHGGGCAIFREVGACAMPKEGIFCRVVTGGTVKAGDPIRHVPRQWRLRIITLSDRAFQGVYEDQSGPRARMHLESFCERNRWRPQIESIVLPDDADRLRAELVSTRGQGVDVVITTGGTGIGPRDITPEVVMSLADKLIPGVMEHIRLLYGAQKPNALLSRSVAAVMGKTLVYSLPGSVKAVDEYLGEILKTMAHAVYMLHSLDAH
ncbi:MAG TPA: molybdopterin-binding protein [Candidatus Hydrogenedentes bacterium]|nr:molybdopterin-binding protein [Candidatus Hydrogenedentota bacterium]